MHRCGVDAGLTTGQRHGEELADGRLSGQAFGGAALWLAALTSLVLTVPATERQPAPDALADGVLLTRALDCPMVTRVPKRLSSSPRAAAVAM